MTALRSWLVPILLGLLLAALLGTSAVLHAHQGRDVDPGMLVAARTEATNFFSLDYRHADTDVDRVLALATGKFKKDYASRRDEVVTGVTKKKLVVTAAIPQDGAVERFSDGDHGQVLVAVDVSTGTLAGASTTNRYRTRILLTRVHGRWLVSDLNQVGVITMKRLLIVALSMLVVAAGVVTWKVGHHDEPAAVQPKVLKDGRYRIGTAGDADAQAALKVAVATLPAALSYDYRSLDKSVDAATAKMTSGFAAEFRDTFDKTTRAMATEKKAITSALVRGAGIVGSIRDGKATVLVYLDQVLVSSKNKKASDPLKVSQNRVHVTLRKVSGHWRVSDIEPF